MFCTTPFVAMARTIATTLKIPDLRIVEVAHPLGGLKETQVNTRADAVLGAVVKELKERT